MIRYRSQLCGSHELFQYYTGYNTFSSFMIDVLKLKLRFATDVLTERSDSFSEPGLIFFHSDLNFLMEFLYFTG